jgi:hypothetical protein
MKKQAVAAFVIILIVIPLFSGCVEDDILKNSLPVVEIEYPQTDDIVSGIVKITGTALDADGIDTVKFVEIKINSSDWERVEGTSQWSYDWVTYRAHEGSTMISVRAWDGTDYSLIVEVNVFVQNPKISETDAHKWAVFVIAANFPATNETKLGNGGLFLAEEMARFFIENHEFPTNNIFILFDDGWIRADNGYGARIETLQQRTHPYDINYGGATEANVEAVLYHVIRDANRYSDSTVFLWFAGHGWGDEKKTITGGKILERSALFLWDGMITDKKLGDLLYSLRADKTCIIVDACFSGGFADKTILDFPTFFLIHSGITGSHRVVMSGASKYRVGYASTTRGPLFSLLWFQGLQSGEADGYRSGFRSTGKPPLFAMFQDGKVSAEEAFYYARYTLRTDETFADFSNMEPQINDQYPNNGNLRSRLGLIF